MIRFTVFCLISNIILSLLFLSGCCCCFPPPSTDSTSTSSNNGNSSNSSSFQGANVTLIHDDGTDIMGAINEDTFLLMAQAATKNDQDVLKELLRKGYIYRIKSGTKAKMIEEYKGLSRIKILEGSYTGKQLIVFTVSIK